MIIVLTDAATPKEIKRMAKDLKSYIKVVVDIDKEILAGGGERHIDAEQTLLAQGSKQADLWGGGYDLETGIIDYNSMINVRPNQNNPSRDIMSQEIRNKLDEIVRELLINSYNDNTTK